ncbi:MAG: valine--tRNA ligase [Bdellovibrionales bacterium]|nr:valine--tRNA ligase [Bdellovibrionales bacterium]
MKTLKDRYQPEKVESNIYKKWIDADCFKAEEKSKKPPFSIILPPPNVTGFLHLGHALDQSIQDIFVRWKRMQGYNVLWLPATDHAGIATQAVVEKELNKKGITKQSLGKENFLKEVWKWKEQYGHRIIDQMKSLGHSCDWGRLKFTLDQDVSRAVKKVFVKLYDKGLIYKGLRLVNWSTKLESAVSDLEVEHKNVSSFLWYIKYNFVDEKLTTNDNKNYLVVATTRPETLLGDTAVAVHPKDERYKNLIGKKIKVPFVNRQIIIISDPGVDKDFGTGAVKLTPAHDFNDYEMAKKHNLEFINILNQNGILNKNAGPYEGLNVLKARAKLLEDLKEKNLFIKEEPHKHSVGHCSRSGCVIEPFLSKQWFLKTKELSVQARRAVETETTKFEPESWSKTYLHWLEIIQDWCISRQLWWGHQIPAWNCMDCLKVTVSEGDLKNCQHCKSLNIQADPDVLDTWFSSALWPFSTLGWPEETELQKTFYPTSLLITGHDIIFFWVARMMMMGLEFKKDVPFRTVFVHGLVRDSKGIKMSKSLGNSIDPVELIKKSGADALRFTLASQVMAGKDLKFSQERFEGYRNFMNKIWNAARFLISFESDKLNLKETSSLASLRAERLEDSFKFNLSDSKRYDSGDLDAVSFVNSNLSDSKEASERSARRDASEAVSFESDKLEFIKENKNYFSSRDIWLICKLKNTIKEVDKALENYHIAEAAASVYNFSWHYFCDWYLEMSKNTFYNKDGKNLKEARASYFVAKYVFKNILKLMHPFTPFITEELFSYFKDTGDKDFIMFESFPSLKSEKHLLSLCDESLEEEIDFMQMVVTAVRNIRGENRVKASEKIMLYLSPKDDYGQKVLSKYVDLICNLAGVKECFVKAPESLEKSAVTPVSFKNTSVNVIVPLKGLVDFSEELKRLTKQIDKINLEIKSLSLRLKDENFVKNAPSKVVEESKKSLKSMNEQIKVLKEGVERFS